MDTIATHRDLNGKQLDIKTAGVELLNVLRAVVAVARFIVFAAKALHEHPEVRRRIAAGDSTYLDHFVQEVRRLSPFFPFIAGRVRRPLEWCGYAFPKDAWVILDLYGTNRDPRSWHDPAAFQPERFRDAPNAFAFVPQGAGDAAATHRCPGEELTVQLMKTAVWLLLTSMQYDVPEQDLSVDLSRIPALPSSGFAMSRIRRIRQRVEGTGDAIEPKPASESREMQLDAAVEMTIPASDPIATGRATSTEPAACPVSRQAPVLTREDMDCAAGKRD